MNIELKNVKIHPDMSQETNCFSATIWVDGKKIGQVSNNGHGGCNRYHWSDPVAGRQLEDWSKTQDLEFDFDKLDQIIDQNLAKSETLRWLKRNTKSKTLFCLKSDAKGFWRTVKSPFDAKVKAWLVNKYGLEIKCIANENLEVAERLC